MFKFWKNNLIKYGVSLGVLMLLILALSLPALTIRTLGENVILEGEYRYAQKRMDGGVVDYDLAIQTVEFDDISSSIQSLIIEQSNEMNVLGAELDFAGALYLHLEINDENRVTSIYLDKIVPDDKNLYLTVQKAFLDYDNNRDTPEDTPVVSGLRVEFDLKDYHMSSEAIDALNDDFDDRQILVYTRIYKGQIQVMEIKKP